MNQQTGTLRAEYINGHQQTINNQQSIPFEYLPNFQMQQGLPVHDQHDVVNNQQIQIHYSIRCSFFEKQKMIFSYSNLTFFLFVLSSVISRMCVLSNYQLPQLSSAAFFLLPLQNLAVLCLSYCNQMDVRKRKERQLLKNQFCGVSGLIFETITSICVFISIGQDMHNEDNQQLLIMFILFFISLVLGYIIIILLACKLRFLIIKLYGKEKNSSGKNKRSEGEDIVGLGGDRYYTDERVPVTKDRSDRNGEEQGR